MLVVPFDLDSHRQHAIKLLESRNMSEFYVSDLPEHGRIAFDLGEPVAMGFIRRMEGPYALLDSYISNRKALPLIRNRALDLITKKLVEECKRNNIRKVLAFSLDLNTFKRSLKHGFVATDYSFSSLTFKD